MKGWLIAILWLVSAILLAVWPLSRRYTSLGLDLEQPDGRARIRCTFYRLRWPGDGSVCVARLVEHRAADAKPLERFDLGGRFFKPAKETRPATAWNRRGFWWITDPQTPAAAAAGMAPGASEVVLAGIPHWLLVVSLTALAFAVSRKRPRTPRDAAALQSPPATDTLGDR
jgi:hypothetical protein